MRKVFSLDRIEGNIAVLISDDGIKLDVEMQRLGDVKVRDVLSAEFDGEGISDIVYMPEERDRRLRDNTERLKKLIERSKNK